MNSLNRSPTSINYFDFLNYPSGWLPLQSPPRCYRTHNQLGLPPPSPTSCSPQEGSHSPGGFILTDEQQRRPGPTKISILLIQECLVLTFLMVLVLVTEKDLLLLPIPKMWKSLFHFLSGDCFCAKTFAVIYLRFVPRVIYSEALIKSGTDWKSMEVCQDEEGCRGRRKVSAQQPCLHIDQPASSQDWNSSKLYKQSNKNK